MSQDTQNDIKFHKLNHEKNFISRLKKCKKISFYYLSIYIRHILKQRDLVYHIGRGGRCPMAKGKGGDLCPYFFSNKNTFTML